MLARKLSSKFCLILFLGLCIGLTAACTRRPPTEYALYLKQLEKDKQNKKSVSNEIEKSKVTQKKIKKKIKTVKKAPLIKEKGSIWLLIDTKKMLLEVKRGKKTVAIFKDIAIGRHGAGFKNTRGDKITPLGTYKIGWINDKSTYHIFYGFTYPSVENAKTALKKGLISESDYNSIILAHANGETPPQHTPLGGLIGLHGVGSASKKIHDEFKNWTSGCIAVTDEQIDALSQWVSKGTKVTVK